MALTSESTTVWKGTLFEGSGDVNLDSSGLASFQVTWDGRSDGRGEHDQPRGAARRRALVVLLDGALARTRAGRQPGREHPDHRRRDVRGRQGRARQPPARERPRPRHHRGGVRGVRRRREGELPDLEGARASRSRSKPNSPDPCGARRRCVRIHRRPRSSTASRADGHEVVRLVRRRAQAPDEASWSPAAGIIDFTVMDRVDAVVNLSGASLARMPWTKGYRNEILDSRVSATRTLADAMRKARRRAAHLHQRVGGRLLRRPPGRTAHRVLERRHRVPRRSRRPSGRRPRGSRPRRRAP